MSSDTHDSHTQIVSYSGLDDTYYVSVKRDQSSSRRRAKSALVAIPTAKLKPESDLELAVLLDQADCNMEADDRRALRSKSKRFRRQSR